MCLCRQEEEKHKQLELLKKREERQQKQAELEAQMNMWSPPDDVEVSGAGQLEGGPDQMWSTDQRGIRMPWTGASVSSPVGAPSLLEIQEQEFKHAEQKVRGERGRWGRGRGRGRWGRRRGREGGGRRLG